MKKALLILAITFAMISCSNEARQSYEQIMGELSSMDLYECDLQTLQFFSEKIEGHLSNFPDYSDNYNLTDINENIIRIADNKMFQGVVSMIEQVRSSKFNDYDEAEESINTCITALNHYIGMGKSEDNRSKARDYIANLQRKISNIGIEKDDFYNAIYSNDVSLLESFIRSYPNSVMKGSVIDRMDQIYYSEFLNSFSSSPNTIEQLNRSLSSARNLLSKLQSIEVKNQVSEAISNLESSRRSVMEAELNDRLQDLMDQMENAAKDKAKRTHPTYKVEMCTARGSNPEVVGNSSTFERLYQVNMTGAFLGIDKREMLVAVSGRISGNLNSGVTIQITGSRIDSDIKK